MLVTDENDNLVPVSGQIKKPKAPKLLTLIDNSNIKESNSNGGRTQNLLYVDINKIWYRLEIHSESVVSQSYIRLKSSNDRSNWIVIKSGNPSRDFGIDISYRNFSQDAFSRIIKDYEAVLKKLIKASL